MEHSCTGKYKQMAEEFRKDGCDKYTIEKFIRRSWKLMGLPRVRQHWFSGTVSAANPKREENAEVSEW